MMMVMVSSKGQPRVEVCTVMIPPIPGLSAWVTSLHYRRHQQEEEEEEEEEAQEEKGRTKRSSSYWNF